MNGSISAIVRSLLALGAVIIMTAGASPEAVAQEPCNLITLFVNNVFPPRPSNPYLEGVLTLTSPSGVFTEPFSVDMDAAYVFPYDPAAGIPTNVVLDINGTSISAGETRRITDSHLPMCVCLDVTVALDISGCVTITIAIVCC